MATTTERNKRRISRKELSMAVQMFTQKNGQFHPSQLKNALSDYFSVPVGRFSRDEGGWFYTILVVMRVD